MSQAGEGRKQFLSVPHRLEADVAESCDWKMVVKVPCASKGGFSPPFLQLGCLFWAHCGSSSVLFLPNPVLVSRGMCWALFPDAALIGWVCSPKA